MCILFRENMLSSSPFLGEGGGPKTFQNRIVSSGEADATLEPSGLCIRECFELMNPDHPICFKIHAN
jgi:hypothetical protein